MKKIIIPLVIAAIAGITAAIIAVNGQKATAGEELPELKCGNYYLDGNAENGLYLAVTDEFIALRGDDLETDFKEALQRDFEDMTAEEVEHSARESAEDYSAENPYVIKKGFSEKAPYYVLIHWTELPEDPDAFSGYGYFFNGTDTLSLSGLGDFILAEPET